MKAYKYMKVDVLFVNAESVKVVGLFSTPPSSCRVIILSQISGPGRQVDGKKIGGGGGKDGFRVCVGGVEKAVSELGPAHAREHGKISENDEIKLKEAASEEAGQF